MGNSISQEHSYFYNDIDIPTHTLNLDYKKTFDIIPSYGFACRVRTFTLSPAEPYTKNLDEAGVILPKTNTH